MSRDFLAQLLRNGVPVEQLSVKLDMWRLRQAWRDRQTSK